MSRRGLVGAEPGIAACPAEGGLGVGQLMSRARTSLLASLDAELERFGLNSTQFIVLKHLGEGAARTAADLCRLNRYDTGAMTRILDRLEAKGLVRRERGREDRRVVFLRLAPAGRALLPRLMAVGTRVLEVHLAGFSEPEIDALKGYLHRMIDNGRSLRDNHASASGGKP
jgi:DNA-binding MarR family transcriptional regulator